MSPQSPCSHLPPTWCVQYLLIPVPVLLQFSKQADDEAGYPSCGCQDRGRQELLDMPHPPLHTYPACGQLHPPQSPRYRVSEKS